jgi:Cu(I)/Ag(I) efflux system periplasmic protein CusF
MRTLAICLLAALLPAIAGAQSATTKEAAKPHKGVAIVKSVDKEKGTVTLAHEPIPSLRWPAMTMRFIAKDKKVLDKLTEGRKVEFEFVQQGRDYVVTKVK